LRFRFFSSPWGPIAAGAVIGVLAALLACQALPGWLGNPPNMGLCVGCFTRDIAGALGLHRAAAVQYLRPEIIGLVFGALLAALAFGEFRVRAGSSPLVRFFLGVFASIGMLVFLGCPWRAYLRLAGGDLNSLLGLAGLCAGVAAGVVFLRDGFSLGRNRPAPRASGFLLPALLAALLILLLAAPVFSPGGPIFFTGRSPEGKPLGPGALHAFWAVSLFSGLLIGFLAQRSRFCTIAGIRDLLLMGDRHLLWGILAFILSAAAANLILGRFHAGFSGQPVAHADHFWNFASMTLAGLCFVLAGGCPGRQLVLAGEGDGDAAVFLLGLLGGAAVAHNFALTGAPETATSPGGPNDWGRWAVVAGLFFCAAMGLLMREPRTEEGG
jgi:hypothetical protein